MRNEERIDLKFTQIVKILVLYLRWFMFVGNCV